MDPKAAAPLMPAFPTGHADEQVPSDGLTMRDYFAAKAMQGAFTSPIPSSDGEKDYIAMHAYKMADAMLRARGQS